SVRSAASNAQGSGALSWVDLADLPTPRQEVAVAAANGKLYVAGGFARDTSTVDVVEVYDAASDSWTAGPPLPIGLNHAVATAVDDRVFVVGGHPTGGPEAVDSL